MNAQQKTQETPLFFRPKDVVRLYKISQSTLYRAIKKGTIQKPTTITSRFTGWPRQVIEKALGEIPETTRPAKEIGDIENLVNSLIRLHSTALSETLAASSILNPEEKDLDRADILIQLIIPLLDLSSDPTEELSKHLEHMQERIRRSRIGADSMKAAQ